MLDPVSASARMGKMRATNSTVVKRSPEAVFRVVDGEAVIVEPGRGLVNVVNEVGTRVWEWMDGVRSVDDIARLVCDEFEVTPEEAARDVLVFVSELIENKLAEI